VPGGLRFCPFNFMTPILAAQALNPVEDGQLLMRILLLLVLVGTLANIGVNIWGRRDTRRIEPQPLEVVAGKQYMSRGEYDLMHQGISREVEGMSDQLREVRQQREADQSVIRADLAALRSDVAALKATQEVVMQRIATLEAKIDRFIERMGALPA
jgi:hypothetical protein